MNVGVDASIVQRIITQIFPRRRVSNLINLQGGLINTNLLLRFDSGESPLVLRIYRGAADVCRKEVAVLRLLRGSVPVPEVFRAEPEGCDGSPPVSVLEYVEGITFQQLKRTKDLDAIHQASQSVGTTLGTIGTFMFSKPGRFIVQDKDTIDIGAPYTEGANPISYLTDLFLSSPTLQLRLAPDQIAAIHDFVWSRAATLPDLDPECRLVHSDFGNANILVREEKGKWVVAAVLDWEFAFSGSPLLDVGHFLRYEDFKRPLCEPYFSRAFQEHGGKLPDDWNRIVRVIDLTALVECLTHTNLPSDAEAEIIKLISATLNDYRTV